MMERVRSIAIVLSKPSFWIVSPPCVAKRLILASGP